MGPTCGELKAGKTTCIYAVLALFLLTGLQLCLPNRALLINAHAHYNNRHKMMPSVLMMGINTSHSRQTSSSSLQHAGMIKRI